MWAKEDSYKFRQLTKEKKTPDEIIEFFGRTKLLENPKRKYVGVFSNFILNEIYMTPKETVFNLKVDKSKHFKNKLNYKAEFKTSSNNEYILNLEYVEDSISPFKKDPMYNISFTIKEQYDITDYSKYEKETNKGEIIELTKRLIYVIKVIDTIIRTEIENPIYIIGITDNQQKINFYRNIIKDSIKDYKEILGKSSINLGKDAYYYINK